MKKLFICIFLCVLLMNVNAVEEVFLGPIARVNSNITNKIMPGFGFFAALDLGTQFALGVSVKAGYNFDLAAMDNIEGATFFRWYYWGSFFAQPEVGIAFYYSEGGRNERGKGEFDPLGGGGTGAISGISGGLAMGVRLPLTEKLYLEPTVRGGYPFPWEVGLAAVFSTGIKRHTRNMKTQEEIDETFPEWRRSDVEWLLWLSNVQFLPNSTELVESEKFKLRYFAGLLRTLPGSKIEIVGHTAMAGSAAGRNRISTARAEAVAAYLIELGAINESDITISALGGEHWIGNNSTSQGMSLNRRVEIIIHR